MRNRIALCLSALCHTALAAAALSVTSSAAAQEEDDAAASGAADGEFSVQRFEPAAGPNNYMSVERLRMKAKYGWSAGLWFNYSRDPFVVVSCVSATDCGAPNATNSEDIAIVSNMMTFDIVGSFAPTEWMQLGLRFPLSFVSGQRVADDGTVGDDLSGFGPGDPNIEGKFRFYGDADSVVALGGAIDLGFGLGSAVNEDHYIGNSSPVSIGWRGIADFKIDDLFFGANLRGIFRGESRLGTTTVGPVEFRYGVGAGYQISPVFAVMAEGTGSTQFSGDNGTNTLEIDLGPRITPLETGLAITAAGGFGVASGVGVPVARGILGVQWNAEGGDQDSDAVGDEADQCPTKAEDLDGFEDADGCPDPDNDKDGVADESDKCPGKMEESNGFEDEDGCPDNVKDGDEDGVPDTKDKCPEEKGTSRLPEYYGCADTDSDGVPNPVDKCADGAEDTDGFEDTDGCPDPDNDKDGVLDEADECGDKPETKNGFQDEDGCPDEDPAAKKP